MSLRLWRSCCWSPGNVPHWHSNQRKQQKLSGHFIRRNYTRAQTLQLLEKFQKARVFEDVRGAKHQEPIGENGRLYKIIQASPTKVSRTPVRPLRTPLATRPSTHNTEPTTLPPAKLDFGKDTNEAKAPTLPDCHLVASSKLTDGEAEDVWKALTLSSLQKLLQLNSLDDILDGDYVDVQNIIHNMSYVNKNGVVCNIKREDQLPHWVLTAMRCLAHWPNKVEDNLPDYPGFERDVYKVVKDYFEGLDEPLLTFSMYEVFTNVFVCAENAGRLVQLPSGKKCIPPGGITSFASVENLMMDLTMNGMNTEDEDEEENAYQTSCLNRAYHPARSCDPRVNGVVPGLRRYHTAGDLNWDRTVKYASTRSLVPTKPEYSTGQLSRYPSTMSMPLQGDRLETSFGIDDRSPRTHLVPSTSSFEQGYKSFASGMSRHRSATGLLNSNHQFSTTVGADGHYGTDESFFHNEHKCLSTNDVHRLVPYPENGLSKHYSSCKSSYSSIPESAQTYQTNDETYGYTVVLSTTPKASYLRDRPYSTSNLRNAVKDNLNVHSDHDYFKKGKPPPYIPPPSYSSIHNRPPPSVNSSRSSYETAPSHPPTPDSFRDLYSSQYISQPDLYQSKQDQNPSGKHESSFSSRRFESGSYRKAIDRDHSYTTPLGRSLFRSQSILQRSQSSPNLSSPTSKARMIDCLRICCMMLPPPNRRKLHLLFRLMVKLAENEELVVDDDTPTRELVLQTFTRCIIRSAEEADFDEVLSLRLVWFMMENYSEIMKVPEELKSEIEERIAYLRRSKVHLVWDTLPSSSITYCAQVSVEEYERRKMSNSQRAISTLLDSIVQDKTMAPKDKKRRMKQFQKSYPEIYASRFPDAESEAKVLPQKQPRIKPALLSRPLAKLKSFRM